MKIAYLSQHRLYLKDQQSEPKTIESKFALSYRDNMVKMQQNQSWKNQGRGEGFLSGATLWGGRGADGNIQIAMTAVGKSRKSGEILYALRTGDIGGVFAMDLSDGNEERLFHNDHNHIFQISAQGGENARIVCSVMHSNSTANIAVMNASGSQLKEITEGDSLDQSPYWIPNTQKVVFQSSGIGRNYQGYFLALGPFAIEELDLEKGNIETRLENPDFDFLQPKVAEDGSLYCIRRPYKPYGKRSFGKVLGDILLSPFRLIYAFYQWLNFFTMRYTGKPMTTAGTKHKGPDIKEMMIWGNLIEASQYMSSTDTSDDPTNVPSSWQLVKLNQDNLEVIAKKVLCYDVCKDGSVVYSDGKGIYLHDPTGKTQKICESRDVLQLVVVE